jgi:hypothetical protein
MLTRQRTRARTKALRGTASVRPLADFVKAFDADAATGTGAGAGAGESSGAYECQNGQV